MTFVTGHGLSGLRHLMVIDWQALARGSPVIVLYMALNISTPSPKG